MAIDEKELEKLLNSIDFKSLTPKQITGENGLLKLFNKKIIERAMGSEMDQHLGYVKHEPAVRNSGNPGTTSTITANSWWGSDWWG